MSAALYESVVRHARTKPIRHAFHYRTYQWLIDLDDPPRLRFPLRFLARFDPRDHFDGDRPIRDAVLTYLSENGISVPGGRILMLANARVFGYVFNPLTVYWCHRADGTLAAVVAEVHNTYGQRHCYLLNPDEEGRAETDKAFYVSPFFDVSGRYRMTLPEPDDHLSLMIQLDRDGTPVFVATLRGDRRTASVAHLLATVVRHPWETLAVSARIRFQGISLYLRRLPIVPRPVDPRPILKEAS